MLLAQLSWLLLWASASLKVVLSCTHGVVLAAFQSTIREQLNLSKPSVADWCNFCRDVCTQHVIDHTVPIGEIDAQGIPIDVEIDETLYFKRKANVGQMIEHDWVLGGVQRNNPRHLFMVPVPDRTAQTLLPIIQQWVQPGSRIITDLWQSYNQLQNLGYQHDTINHSLHFVDPQNPTIHTQNIEGFWKHAKAKL